MHSNTTCAGSSSMIVRCHITLSGQAEPLLAVVERMRAELVATLAAAGRSDLTRPPEAEPATAGG